MRLALVPVALAVLALSGCANSVYYQTRYAPTSSEQSFGFGERLFWSEDKEVYELPANPPAIATDDEDLHRSRVECREPGQQFKPGQVATGGGTEVHGTSLVDGPTVGTMGDDTTPRSPRPERPQPISGWHDEPRYGTRETRDPVKVVGPNLTPISAAPGSRIDKIAPNPISTIGDDTGWCPPATAPVR